MVELIKTTKFSESAFLNLAREYHNAANTLFPTAQEVKLPIYFLYVHALELAFKAYLEAHHQPTPKCHDLEKLCSLCIKCGLPVGKQEFANVIQGLGCENDEHGFRYYQFKSTVIPTIDYLRDFVDAMMLVIAEDVDKQCVKGSKKGVVVKMTFGKPQRKNHV